MESGPMTVMIAAGLLTAVIVVLVPGMVAARPPVGVLLGLYAFVLPFGSAVEFPGIPAPFNSLSSLVGMLVAALLLFHLIAGRRARDWTDSTIAWLMLTGWVGMTVLWSVNPDESLMRYLILLSLVALYAIGTLLPLTRRDIRWMEVGIVAGAVCVSCYAVYLGATGTLQPQPDGRLPRFSIETGGPNITAASMLLPWVLTVWASLNASSRRVRGISMAATAVISAAIVLTGSRGALVAGSASLCVILLYSSSSGRKRAVPYLAALFVVAASAYVVAPAALQNHLLETDSTGRVQIWTTALSSCTTSGCWTGNGWGAFGDVYRTTYLSDLSVQGYGDKTWAAHNIFVAMLAEGGVIGLLLLVAAFALLARSLHRLPRAVAGPAMAGLTALVVSNLLLSNMGFKYFWFTLLYGSALVALHAAGPGRQVRPVPRIGTSTPGLR